MVVHEALLDEGDDIVDTPGSLAGNFFAGCSRSGLCCTLIRAAARGDLEKVKRCLAAKKNITKLLFCQHVGEFASRTAAQYGHAHIMDVLLAEWERRATGDLWLMIDRLQRDVLCIACQSGNLEMAVRVLWARNTVCDQGEIMLFGSPSLVRPEVSCSIEFFRKIIQVMRECLDYAGRKMSPRWLKEVLENAIKFGSLPHVETVLDEMDPNQSGKIFTHHPRLMSAVFRSRCASILRCVLLRYPKVFTHNAKSNPVVVINKYYWPTGARLLVEAGAKCKGSVPAEHAGILTLSLEEKCRIVARRSLKSPLSENVEKLPLPAKAKRRFLYRWS